LTIDLDATLITDHAGKEGAAGSCKGGYGFDPLHRYLDETGRHSARCCGPGTPAPTRSLSAGSRSKSRFWIPKAQIERLDVIVRADIAGAAHDLTATAARRSTSRPRVRAGPGSRAPIAAVDSTRLTLRTALLTRRINCAIVRLR